MVTQYNHFCEHTLKSSLSVASLFSLENTMVWFNPPMLACISTVNMAKEMYEDWTNPLNLSLGTTKVKVKITQLCLILCHSIVHGILQARILEWVAFPFSRGSSQSRDWIQVSHIAGGFLPAEPQGSPRIIEWVASPFFSGSSWPRNPTGVSCIEKVLYSPGGRFFTNWGIREALGTTNWSLMMHENHVFFPTSFTFPFSLSFFPNSKHHFPHLYSRFSIHGGNQASE